MTAPLFSGMGGHHSARSTTDVWLTPPRVLTALGGPESFDLDPASPQERPWPTARTHYTRIDNGLLLPWFGRVYLNPPYGTELGQWMGRMADHGHGVALIFARTETAAFERHVWKAATALLFLFGRLNFLGPDGKPRKTKSGGEANAGAPSVLCAYGQNDAEVLASCGLDGQFIPLLLPRVYAVLALDLTWSEAVAAWLARQSGPVPLADAYRAFAAHPKARRNPNYRAKIRQVLQEGPFRRVARGVWAAHPQPNHGEAA